MEGGEQEDLWRAPALLSKSPPWWEETGIHGELKESAIQVVTEGHTRGKMLTSTKESESFTHEAALELVLEGGNFSGAGVAREKRFIQLGPATRFVQRTRCKMKTWGPLMNHRSEFEGNNSRGLNPVRGLWFTGCRPGLWRRPCRQAAP